MVGSQSTSTVMSTDSVNDPSWLFFAILSGGDLVQKLYEGQEILWVVHTDMGFFWKMLAGPVNAEKGTSSWTTVGGDQKNWRLYELLYDTTKNLRIFLTCSSTGVFDEKMRQMIWLLFQKNWDYVWNTAADINHPYDRELPTHLDFFGLHGCIIVSKAGGRF